MASILNNRGWLPFASLCCSEKNRRCETPFSGNNPHKWQVTGQITLSCINQYNQKHRYMCREGLAKEIPLISITIPEMDFYSMVRLGGVSCPHSIPIAKDSRQRLISLRQWNQLDPLETKGPRGIEALNLLNLPFPRKFLL